jgi:YHS domain-containing protein
MAVDPDRVAGTRTVGDRKFYLCSRSCLEKFDRDPDGYARRASGEEKSHTDRSGHGRRGCC